MSRIWILLLFLMTPQVYAQEFTFEHITTEEGLSQSTVNSIIQDSRGFMWFGTNDGLDKYDGYLVHRYSHEKTNRNSLSKNSVLKLYEDAQGIIWIGTYGGGLNRFDYSMQEFTSYQYNPDNKSSLSNNQVFEIFEDSEGLFWIGTEHGVNLFSRETGTFTLIANNLDVPFGKTESITEDRLGDVWLASGNGIFRYSRLYKTYQRYVVFENDKNPKPDNFIWEVYVDRKGDLWVGSMWGLSKFDYAKNLFTDYVPQNKKLLPEKMHVRNIYEDKSGNFWIGTDGSGLLLFNRDTKAFTKIENDTGKPDGFRGNVITSICEDRTGNLWFGTFKSGVNKIDKLTKKFYTWKSEPGNTNSLLKSDIKAVFQDREEIVWVGTEKGGLSRINRKTGNVRTWLNDPEDNNSLPSNVVLTITRDTKNRMWIGTFGGGLCNFDNVSERFYTIPEVADPVNNKTSNVIWTLLADISGSIWVGTWGAGLQLFDPENGTFKHYNIVERGIQSNNSVLSICRDYQGYIWIGTYGDGLKKLNPLTGEVRHFRRSDDEPSSLIDNVVHVVFEDADRNLWIGTKDGLDLFDRTEEGFTHYSTHNGLPNNVINGILQDDNGYLWISTNKGITRFIQKTKEFRNYNLHDGLQGNEFNKGVCYEAINGDFLFGGVNGLNIFNPNDIVDNPHIPNVLITEMKIRNVPVKFNAKEKILQKHISATKSITLPYNFSVLTFDFVALNLTKPEKNQYAYFLKNYDEDWRYVNDQRTATYTNLNPGEYEFVVKASNNDGLWNETGTSVLITVTPPYWKTWWFRAIIVVLIWGGFTILFMLRTRIIKRQKAELEVLVEKRTQELRLQKTAVESKNAELELQKQEIIRQRDQVEKMTKKVHDADQMKLRFFTNISHEFRTPLTLILGPVEKLLNSNSSKHEINDQLSLIHRNALRLLRLVNEIMDFRKIETGRMKLRVTNNDLTSFIHDVYFSFNELAKKNRINYLFTSTDNEITGWFDRDKLEKILFNIIANAFKFTPPGGQVTVHVDQENRFNQKNNTLRKYAVIKVKDTGKGISPEHLQHIFDRFYQVGDHDSSIWQGSGIGLSFTKNLVDIHYGDIAVNSIRWKGTEFTVSIPIDKDKYSKAEIIDSFFKPEDTFMAPLYNLNNPEPENTQQPAEVASDSEKATILLVEDNADVRLYIKEEIKGNFNILEAENGKQALQIAKSQQIDLIVSDIMMPEMDGLELCRIIKTNIGTSHIPVILLTARTSDSYKLKGLETGADDYIYKPFNATVLSARIKNLIQSRKMLKEQFSRNISLSPKDITVTSPDEKFLSSALEIIEKHISDSEFNVDKLVEKVGMSRSVFYRKLKSLTGESANDFIKTIRLKRAAQILRQNKLTISEVSYEVGFNDPQYFSKCFHKQFGKTPSQFVAESATLN